jgi:hypothetical protein
MAIIKSGATDDLLSIHPTAKAARVLLYDAAGSPIVFTDRASLTPGSVSGMALSGADYRSSRVARVSSDNALRNSNDTVLLWDDCEGAAYDLNKWVQTATTMTLTQAAATGMLFNSGSTTTTTTGIMLTSHRQFQRINRGGLVARYKARITAHSANNLVELGFGTPSSATTAAIGNGAVWRKEGTGQYVPVLAINGSEVQGNPVSQATILAAIPATDYALFEVQIFDEHAHFCIWSQAGILVAAQDIEFSGTGTPHFSVTHMQALMRIYNSGTVSTAVQMYVHSGAVFATDAPNSRTFREQMSAMGYSTIQSPTAYTQLANWTNNAAPTTRTPSNTAAAESTLGGIVAWNNAGTSFAASDTADLILFGFQVPSPLTLFLTGLNLSTVNLGAANAAAPYTIQYGLATGSSAVSLATAGSYPPMRQALGFQSLVASAGIGAVFDRDIGWNAQTPIAVQPGRFVHLIARVIGASAATASQVIRTAVNFNGWFE